jgi:hypothetical protein
VKRRLREKVNIRAAADQRMSPMGAIGSQINYDVALGLPTSFQFHPVGLPNAGFMASGPLMIKNFNTTTFTCVLIFGMPHVYGLSARDAPAPNSVAAAARWANPMAVDKAGSRAGHRHPAQPATARSGRRVRLRADRALSQIEAAGNSALGHPDAIVQT